MAASRHPNSTEQVLYVIKSNDGAVVFDPSHDRFLNLNSTAIDMWMRLNTGNTEGEVAKAISHEYGVEEAVVAEDLRTLVRMMQEQSLSPDCLFLTDEQSPAIQTQLQKQPSFPWYGKSSATPGPRPKRLTTLGALLGLAAFDLILFFRSFNILCSYVHRWPIRQRCAHDKLRTMGAICRAVDEACVWYPKKALCLQRSAVTACLLRLKGIPAQLVVGVHPLPFSAHAWVETDGAVINDFPAVRRFYRTVTSY